MLIRCFFISLALAACRTAPLPPVGERGEEYLFLFGRYTLRGQLEMQDDQGAIHRRDVVFLVRARSNRFSANILGPLGVTLAVYDENLVTGDKDVKVARGKLGAHRQRIEEFFGLLRDLMLFPKREEKRGSLRVLRREGDSPVQFSFSGGLGTGTVELVEGSVNRQIRVSAEGFSGAIEVKKDSP